MASSTTTDDIRNTVRFTKTVDELQPHEQGYDVASKVERRNRMREIEQKIQLEWEKNRTFEEDASSGDEETFFCNFPYPYMNGRLHLGHAFTITKADFAAGYHRLKGKKVLFPFAFHCTGMPIQASANKLKREIEELYGLENLQKGNFELLEKKQEPKEKQGEDDIDPETAAANKAKGGKTKLLAKTGNVKGKRAKTQWEILQMCSVPEEEIPKFVDPQHWLFYFPPLGQDDLKQFGVHVDWRRSFLTTNTNPYYDSFVQWQFRHLKAQNKIAFGKRATVYSRRDQQACMDHDRASGEGKGPQEYTLIKMQLLPDGVQALSMRLNDDNNNGAKFREATTTSLVYLVAATLRAETMYGQTNCFVLPEGLYGAYQMKNGEIFVCSDHAAVNLAHQAGSDEGDRTAVWGQADHLIDLTGQMLMGLPLKAPNSSYERIYTLPLLTISMTKGTGIVTSVPSDAPDDYAALRDMQTKPELREKYGIEEKMVKDYNPIPIIRIPGGDEEIGVEDFGAMAAVTACQILKVRDQHDKTKLAKIKKSVYNKGFYAGVMTVGSHSGKKVEEAKELVKKELIQEGHALRYWEPEEEIMSRSGDKCIIAFIDQWFLTYGEESWKNSVLEHVRDKTGTEDGREPTGVANTFNAFGVRNEYENTLQWLGNWACSRSFGLGTRVPWDRQFVVESLSDSTIYMAYYAVAHLIQGDNNIKGDVTKSPVPDVSQLTDEVWDYAFLKRDDVPPDCKLDSDILQKMRREFQCWYPFDLRVSGKDLIRNHLTMSLYNHAAIWDQRPDLWPRAFYTNGHVMVDNSKMSKSTGNFISLIDAIAGNNVHLHVPIEKRKFNKVTLKSSAAPDEDAIATTKKPHGFAVGNMVSISKSKNNNGNKEITSVPSDMTFCFASSGEDNSTSTVVEMTAKNWDAHEWRAQSWTTDTVRYALSMAGDTMNDANFESDNANNAILTLENELDWTMRMCTDKEQLRTGDLTIQDQLFLIRMDECIMEADKMYLDMKFSLAIKFAFHDMRNHRKVYRDYHEKCGLAMHSTVIFKFIEQIVIMISPIMTHWSEHVWCHILNKEGSVTRAPWPTTSGLPKELLLQDKYLSDLVTSFRKQLTKKKKGGKKKDAATNNNKKKSAIIFYQPEYPSWKKRLLEWLSGQWDDSIDKFSKDVKEIKADAKKLQQSDDEFKSQKVFLGVVSYVIGQASQIGKVALLSSSPFDECQLLKESQAFLKTSLELEELHICHATNDEEVVEGLDTTDDRQKAEPGNPSLCVL
eukprot:CAMPEP_0194147824 /NCGR_PEP_ID=MMETSP0152-20130528/28058_1 /TAXON_ID=1049557 /ORGANISM="Thalassiothrix antarctica, Strain L6-D1" /LENGTH=1261 /DNA_ID=CAMNT_0038848911 /DNA_START=123 /DNA_END=3908 /DNA_ORIENTATION=-